MILRQSDNWGLPDRYERDDSACKSAGGFKESTGQRRSVPQPNEARHLEQSGDKLVQARSFQEALDPYRKALEVLQTVGNAQQSTADDKYGLARLFLKIGTTAWAAEAIKFFGDPSSQRRSPAPDLRNRLRGLA